MRSVSQSILSLQYLLRRGFVNPGASYFLLFLTDNFVLEGILNALPGFSLFTLVFLYIFTAWLMKACDFCSGFMGDKFIRLSLMLFCVRIGDLCNSCFVGDFASLGVVRVVVVVLNVKTVLFQTIQFSVSRVSMSKTIPFQAIQFSINTHFQCQNCFISSNSV